MKSYRVAGDVLLRKLKQTKIVFRVKWLRLDMYVFYCCSYSLIRSEELLNSHPTVLQKHSLSFSDVHQVLLLM